MKNKTTKIIPLLGIGALILTPIVSLTVINNEVKINTREISQTLNPNFNLETNALQSPYASLTSSLFFKDFISIEQQAEFYTDQDGKRHGPLSENSINTTRSGDHFFNFINNNTDGFIRVVATPAEANNRNVIQLATPYTSVEDSAIFMNNQLFVIGTIGDTKWLSSYEIVEENPNFIQGPVASFIEPIKLVELSRIQLPSITGISSQFKYALSPITKTFEDGDITDFILWPMGISAAELTTNNSTAFKRITIKRNEAPKISDLPTNFSSSNFGQNYQSFPIMSLTPIEIIGQDGNNSLRFYSHLVPINNQSQLSIIQFTPSSVGVDTSHFKIGSNISTNLPWARGKLESAIPYSYVQENDLGFSLFWIAQNGTAPNNSQIAPNFIIRANISIANGSFADLSQANLSITNLEKNNTTGNQFTQNGIIEQIHYGVGGNLETGTYISIRQRGLFETVITQNTWKSSLGLIQLKDGNLNGNSGLPTTVNISSSLKSHSTRSSKSTSAINTPGVMMTTYNGLSIQTGIDPYQFEIGTANPIPTDPAPMLYIRRNAQSFDFDLNSNQVTNTIVLPSKVQEDSKAYDFNLPAKVSDITFSSPLTNASIMSRVRWFINDLNSDIFFFQRSGFNMALSGGVTYWDINNNPISIDPANQATPPPNATAAEFFITIPQPLINGSVSTSSPTTLRFRIIDNPIQGDGVGFSPVTFNSGSQNPEFAAIVLNSFNNSRVIPSNQDVLGITGTELISINPNYLDLSLANISAVGDNFSGTLKGEINFIDPNGNILNVPFDISGLESTLIFIPSVIVPIFVIAIIVLIAVIILRKKNIINSRKSRKAGYSLAKKLDTSHNLSPEDVIGKDNLLNKTTSTSVNNSTRNVGQGVKDAGSPTRNVGQGVPTPGSPTRNVGQGVKDSGSPTRNVGQGVKDAGSPTRNVGQGVPTPGSPTRNVGQGVKDSGSPTRNVGQTMSKPATPVSGVDKGPIPPTNPIKKN